MINENVESGYDSRRTLYDKDIRESLFDFLEESYGKTRIPMQGLGGRPNTMTGIMTAILSLQARPMQPM